MRCIPRLILFLIIRLEVLPLRCLLTFNFDSFPVIFSTKNEYYIGAADGIRLSFTYFGNARWT